MKHKLPDSGDSWEKDAVWHLLDQAPPRPASPAFTENLLRAVQTQSSETPWWERTQRSRAKWLAIPLAAAAALTLVVLLPQNHPATPSLALAHTDPSHADSFAALQEVAETEALRVAIDHLDDFSDTELVSLIGF